MRVFLLVVTLLGLLVAQASAQPRHGLYRSYVALGDSYASGPGSRNKSGNRQDVPGRTTTIPR
ncbi:hypothetical protein [Kibdelosporangium aridum]|uniref:hypothetical protein n=1 Tax=Kibdelosporangium aridum TaxID=2030 RepID=UPI0035ED7C32